QSLFVRCRRHDVRARQARHHLQRPRPWLLDVRAHLPDPSRLPGWPSRAGVGGDGGGRQLLPLREAQFPFRRPQVKILYTNFHPRNGGGHATYVTSLARALADAHQVCVATPDTSRLFRYVAAIPGARAVDMRYSTRPASWFGERAALRRLVVQGGYDIVHVNGTGDHKQVMLALAGLRRRPRVVFTKHNDHPLDTVGHWLRARLATDQVIAVSDYVRGMLEQSPYRRLPITTIRHGIDTDHFAPPA